MGTPVPAWVPRADPPRTPMLGRFCRLEPLDVARHADDLFDAFAAAPDGRDWTYMSAERFDARPAYRAFVADQAASADPSHFAIVDPATGRALGTAALMRIDRTNGVIEIGHILFSPRLQRTAAASEAIFLLMRRAFDELGYRRLEWKCDSLNTPSRRAAVRYGFLFEGIFRQAVVTKGRNRDTSWYAMIDSDWPRTRAAFDRWLAPEKLRHAREADPQPRRVSGKLGRMRPFLHSPR